MAIDSKNKIKNIINKILKKAFSILIISILLTLIIWIPIVLFGYISFYKLITIITMAVLIIITIIWKKRQRRIKKETILVFDLHGNIKEEPPEGLVEALLRPELTFYEILEILDFALKDECISLLLIKIRNLKLGWGRLGELYEHLLKWKKLNKNIYCFLGDSNNKEYFLSTAGNKIFMNEGSILLFNGLGVEIPYFKKLLDKIGIELEIERRGAYKTSFEQFQKEEMSKEHKEMVSSILMEMQNYIVNKVSEERELSCEDVRNLINIGIFSAKTAKDSKLIDEIGIMENTIKNILKENKRASVVPIEKYYNLRRKKMIKGANKEIAVITINGILQEGESSYDPFIGRISGSNDIINLLEEAEKNKEVKGIILRVNSPGGSGSASEILWQKIKDINQKKPIAVSMADVSASGAYYLATASNFISATPLTFTGSIGVLSGKINIKNLLNSFNITLEKIQQAENANFLSIFTSLTEKQKQLLRKINEDFFNLFIERIAEGRKLSIEEVQKIANGRVWLAKEAVNSKLIDKIGGIEEAVNFIKEKLNIPQKEPVKINFYVKKKPLWQKLKLKLPPFNEESCRKFLTLYDWVCGELLSKL